MAWRKLMTAAHRGQIGLRARRGLRADRLRAEWMGSALPALAGQVRPMRHSQPPRGPRPPLRNPTERSRGEHGQAGRGQQGGEASATKSSGGSRPARASATDRPREGRREQADSEPPQRVAQHRQDRPLVVSRGRAAEAAARDAPRGGIWLYGVHAVCAALANPQRRLRRLMLTEEAHAAIASKLAPPWPLAPERTERARIDQLLGRGVVHQGAALLADPLAPPALAQALERPGPVLVLDQVTDPRNIGAILRSAAAFGVAAVLMQDRHAPEEAGAMAKAASGALEAVPLLHAVNLTRTLVALKAAGFWVVGLAAGAPPLVGTTLAGRRVALVLGAEDVGLRRLLRETCDELAGLLMPGGMESLNVSVAAAVALYELARR